MNASPDHQARAEALFQQYLDLEAQGSDVEAFLRQQKAAKEVPAETFVLLETILEDYHALREGRASTSDSRPITGPQAGEHLDDYELLKPLGRGGMGIVWEARQRSLDRRVAVKVLHAHLGISGRFLERFQREAQASGRLQHSGIVAVHGVGESGGTHFIVQELIADGISLETWLQEQAQRQDLPRRDYRQLAQWTLEIAEALAAAHDAGVIHRDLKPGNILLQDGHPKLADFGLASLSEEASISLTGEVLGTPYAMSPEQTRPGGEVGPLSDLFSLGVTLYRLLTFTQPFQGDTREQVLEAIRHHEPIDPRRLRNRIPKELAILCLKLLEKHPEHRYAQAEAVAEDLRRFLDGRPILARPPSALARSWKWIRRNPTPSAAFGVAVAALVIISWFFLDAQQAREDAEDALSLAEDRQKVADAIEGFLIGLFADAGPGGEANADTPAGVLLQRGSDRLQQDESQDPMVRAGLLMALGQVNKTLANHDLAEEQLREALALHEKHLLQLDQRTLKARNQLGLLLLQRARFAEAEEMLAFAQEGHDALYGPNSAEALENQGNLAYAYIMQGDLDRAAPALEASLRGTTLRWGEDHFHVWSARNNLASLQMRRGDFEAAEPIFETVVAHRTATSGAHEPATLSALSNLAQTEQELHQWEDAEQHLQLLLEGCLLTYGEEHPTTASAQRDYGALCLKRDRPLEALELYRASERTSRAKLRAGHPSILKAAEGHIRSLLALDRAEEALPLAQQLVQDAKEGGSREKRCRALLKEVEDFLSQS